MTDMRLVEAYRPVEVTREQSESIWRRLEADAEALSLPADQPVAAASRRPKKLWRTVLIAAVLSSLLGITAYAADFLGIRAMLLPGSGERTYRFERQPDGSTALTEAPEGGMLSLAQPMAIPEDLAPEIIAKVENSAAAWEEWSSWSEEHPFAPPAVFQPPEGTAMTETEDNGDGTYTVIFYRDTQWEEETGRIKGIGVIEERTATAEEAAAKKAYREVMGKLGLPGYDSAYGVYTEERARKIEEIASRYGLALRREKTVLFQRSGEWNVEGSYPLEELVEILSEQCCSGPLFRQNPDRIDHGSYFQEGTFALSYSVVVPGPGEEQKELAVYTYNSPYGTLSSGRELMEMEDDLTAFRARTHTAPDGTELTVLSNGEDAYFYTWLKSSYYAGKVSCDEGLTDAEADAVMDATAFQNIGK